MRFRAACVLAAAAFALSPAAAPAQGAGDDQYVDPFGSEEPAPAQTPAPEVPAPAPEPPGGGDPPPAAPGVEAESQAVPEAAPAPVAEPQTASGAAEQLPYTGADAGLVGAAGAVLLAGGVALRARLRVRT